MMHRKTAFVVVFMMSSALAPAWSQELVFKDAFETGDISSWFGQTNCPPPPQTDCTPPAPANGTTPYNVGIVSAHIMNLDGSDASQIWADVCGTNQCLNSIADVDGNMALDGGGQELVEVRLLYGNGRHQARMAAPLPNGNGGDFGDIHTIDLSSFSEGSEMLAGTNVVQGDVTLSLTADALLGYNCSLYPEPESRRFRSRMVFPSQSLPAVDNSLGLELLIATAPIDTTICPAATLTFANIQGWSADAEVEIFIHGTKSSEHYAPFGEWAKVSDAVVSADGFSVTTNAGEGIEMHGLFGARLKAK